MKRKAPIGTFSIISTGIYGNRKIRRAGRNGREVFQFALSRNAERGRTGSFPASELEPWFIADQLQMSEPEAKDGLQRAIEAQLLAIDGDAAVILGWDETWARAAIGESEARQLRRLRGARALPAKTVTPDPEETDPTPEGEKRERGRSEENRDVRTPPGHCPDTHPSFDHPGAGEVIGAFTDHYEAFSGSQPTWRDRELDLVMDLVGQHEPQEIERRMHNFFAHEPNEFPKSRDFETFSRFFDSFVLEPETYGPSDALLDIANGSRATRDPSAPRRYPSKIDPSVYEVLSNAEDILTGEPVVDHYERLMPDGTYVRCDPPKLPASPDAGSSPVDDAPTEDELRAWAKEAKKACR